MAFAVITDSASNLTNDLLEKYQIDMVSFKYLLDDKMIKCYDPSKDYVQESKKYYNLIRQGKFVKTSLISPQEYYDCFKKHLEKGEDIIYVSISGNLSGTYNSACNAKDMLLEEYPDQKIICVDSQNASYGEAIIAIKASECRSKGMSIEDTEKYISSIRMNIRSEFTVENLIYLKRTGRISLLTYSIGTLFDIKPLLRASRKADIESFGKVRGRKKALLTIYNRLCENIVDPENQIVYIAHCDAEEEALKLANMIKENVKVKDVYVNYYDMCTGSHVGPGTIAIFYYAKERE